MTPSHLILKTYINKFHRFTEAEYDIILGKFLEVNLKRGDKPLSDFKNSDYVIFVTSGIIREYAIIDDKDHTLWISFENDSIIDSTTIFDNQSRNKFIEALCPSSYLIITNAELSFLAKSYPEINLPIIFAYQTCMSDVMNHMMLLKVYPTQKRQEQLYEAKPQLFRKEIKVKHIASMLNVHPNSLSRIHNQRFLSPKYLSE